MSGLKRRLILKLIERVVTTFFAAFDLTQCARIRGPVVSMKIEKFKDLFRAVSKVSDLNNFFEVRFCPKLAKWH